MANELIENKLKLLPSEPGSYQMKDKNNNIIYVGKAKNLKNRVRSYFKSSQQGKTLELVNNIEDFDFIVTNSDKEAFLLENTLIKKYKPYYNIRLKYGNSYPYIKITNEKDPKLELANTIKKDKSFYFGPYPNVYAAQKTVFFLQKTFPLRRCNGFQGRPCIYYSMGQCLGACWREVPEEEYKEQISNIKHFLNGNTHEVIKTINEKIKKLSDDFEFERAASLRDQLRFINETLETQKVLPNNTEATDLFNYEIDKGWMAVETFFIRQSKLLRQNKDFFQLIGEPIDEFENYISQFYQQKNSQLPKEILVPDEQVAKDLQELLDTKVKYPVRGIKSQLIDLAKKNAKIALNQKISLLNLEELKTKTAIKEISDALNIKDAFKIEFFDHSHTQGTNIVSGMVVYENGAPAKNLYRKFKLKSLVNQDETKATEEVIYRRYSRLINEKKPLPDLVVVDGGEIQLNAAKRILNELGLSIPVAAIVKNDKHKTSGLLSFVDGKIKHVFLEPNSQGFFLLQRMQDEVHRFAITFHKQLRNNTSFNSKLDKINGVGPVIRKNLLLKFGSINKIAEAPLKEITEVVKNEALAKRIQLTTKILIENKKEDKN